MVLGVAEKSIKVKGMHCKSCEVLIKDVVSEVPGVKSVSSDYAKGVVKVSCPDSLMPAVRAAIEKEGYGVLD